MNLKNKNIMKKINTLLLAGLVLFSVSCEKQLDINTDPNTATSATPELILPQALTATAANLNGFNSYGAQLVGFSANAGGYGGFGTSISYNFTSSDFSGRWSSSYDNLQDYQYIIDNTAGKPKYKFYNAAARIMKAIGFQLLVDAYNDVPYTDALKGASKLSPTYTKGDVIYKDLAAQLDTAIALINQGDTVPGISTFGSKDVLFGGDMDSWKKLANTIKLRIIIRGKDKVTFANTTFTNDGFLDADALINPGYTRDNGRQNPKWSSWGFSYTGSDANKAWIPSSYIFGFYDGSKLSDNGRGAAIYYKFPATGTNRLGVESNDLQSCPSGSFWYPSTVRDGKTAGSTSGPLKGPEAGYPIMTAAESYFLQAEASLRGIVTGNTKELFESGIYASFDYLYALPDGSYELDPATDATDYLANNASSHLVNFDLALTNETKLEAIITQKYIALNYVNSEEAWNEYRRTKYPKNTIGGSAVTTFTSIVSESTRADKLPTRILYPSSEGSYNSANVPKGISPFTSLIFWAQ
jgi:hypothetical protein